MRYYKIYVDGKLFASQGVSEHNGISIKFNINQILTRNNPNTQIELYNVSSSLFSSNANLVGKQISIFAGLEGYLPTINNKQRGLIFTGYISGQYSSWSGNTTIVTLICNPFEISLKENVFLIEIKKGEAVANSLKKILDSNNIPSVLSIKSLQKIAKSNNKFISKNLYEMLKYFEKEHGIYSYTGTEGLIISLLEEKNIIPPIEIKDIDMVGQPEANGLGQIIFTLQLRADLNIGNTISSNALSWLNIGGAGGGLNVGYFNGKEGKDNLFRFFTGYFVITQIRHVGDSRNSSSNAWITIIECVRTEA